MDGMVQEWGEYMWFCATAKWQASGEDEYRTCQEWILDGMTDAGRIDSERQGMKLILPWRQAVSAVSGEWVLM